MVGGFSGVHQWPVLGVHRGRVEDGRIRTAELHWYEARGLSTFQAAPNAQNILVSSNRTTHDIQSLSDTLVDRRISHVDAIPSGGIAIHFTDGARLTVSPEAAGFTATFHEAVRRPRRAGDPSPRQRQYLQFIMRYLARFGVAPAESDIQEHFLVSAPSVHEMIKTLERRGFIARSRDFNGQALPRSIRVLVDLT